MVTIKSKREIELMKESCRITAGAHKAIEKVIKARSHNKIFGRSC